MVFNALQLQNNSKGRNKKIAFLFEQSLQVTLIPTLHKKKFLTLVKAHKIRLSDGF